MQTSIILRWLIVIVAGVLGFLGGKFEQLEPNACKFLGFFLAVVVGLLAKPIADPMLVFFAVIGVAVTQASSLHEALSGYSQPIVWMVFSSVLMSKGFVGTGLGRRVAFYLIQFLGKRILGIGYALVLTDLFLGLGIPSNSARSGGILQPLVKSVCDAYGSTPTHRPKALGCYLMALCFHADNIICATFVTSHASNMLVVKFAKDVGIDLSYSAWLQLTIVPALISLLLLPLVFYWFYPPEIKTTLDAPKMAADSLKELGPIKASEITMLCIFLMTIILWMTQNIHGLNFSLVALMGLAAVLIFKIFHWHDLVSDHKAWSVFIWYGGLLMLANGINDYGVARHFILKLATGFGFESWVINLGLLTVIYFYTHYIFASGTAHITALFVPFLGLATALNVPVFLSVFSFAMASNLCCGLTHYGTTPASIYFNDGYMSQGTWWKIGFWVSIYHFLIWPITSYYWLSFLGKI